MEANPFWGVILHTAGGLAARQNDPALRQSPLLSISRPDYQG